MKFSFTVALFAWLLIATQAYALMDAKSRTGTFLGYVISTGLTSTMIITTNGKVVNLSADGNIATTNVRFTSTDCTGTPYILTTVKGEIYRNNGNYYESLDVAPINTLQSYRRDDGSCTAYSNIDQWGVQVMAVSSSVIPFTLPVPMPINITATPKVVVIPY